MFDAATPPLIFPAEGIRRGDLLFRVPTEEDVPTIAPAFQDPDVGGRANMPTLDEMSCVTAIAADFEDRSEPPGRRAAMSGGRSMRAPQRAAASR